MGKALDLNLFVNNTLDITLLDNSVLHIRKPSQANVIKLMAFKEIKEDDALTAMDELALLILNSNTDGKAFTAEWLDENLDLMMKSAIIRAYADFINEISSNPN